MVKKVFLWLFLFVLTIKIYAQSNQISLVVSGEGKDKSEATFIALRSAIEQAYGVFISSNTTVINDTLIKDEIISVASGNIKKYDYVSETTLPNGNISVMIKATVSIDNLVKYCENKGMNVEFKGALFAMNIKQKELNKTNEEKVIDDMIKQLNLIIPKMFDYKLSVSEPVIWDGRSNNLDNHEPGYVCEAIVDLYPNSNSKLVVQLFNNTLKSLTLSLEEVNEYKRMNLPTYFMGYTYRSQKSCDKIKDFINKSFVQNALFGFQIKDNLTTSFLSGIYIDKICSKCGGSSSISEISIFPNGYEKKDFSKVELYLSARKPYNGRFFQKTLWNNIKITRVNSNYDEEIINGLKSVFWYQNIPYCSNSNFYFFDFKENEKQYSINLNLFISQNDLNKLTGFSIEPKTFKIDEVHNNSNDSRW